MGMKARASRKLGKQAEDMLPTAVEGIYDEASEVGQDPIALFTSSDPEIEESWFLQRTLGYVEGVADGADESLESLLDRYRPE